MKKFNLLVLFLMLVFQINAQKMTETHVDMQTLMNEFHQINEARKTELNDLASLIVEELHNNGECYVNFICTHNSRRSQLSEIWLRYAAFKLGIKGLYSYSGGSEATAFNIRMVKALQDYGFDLRQMRTGNNPVYKLYINDEAVGPKMFSKKYSHEHNPTENFIAVMVCSDADQNCPLVEGASARVSLPYLDPKAFDNTLDESKAYSSKVKEIGRELLYVLSIVNENQE